MAMSITEQLAYSTVRIECDTPDGVSTGTGFYFRFRETPESHVPAIVTNRHVVEGSTIGRFHVHLSSGPDQAPTSHRQFAIPDFAARWIGHPDPSVDLCVMPLAPLIYQTRSENQELFFIGMSADLLPTAQEASSLTAVEDIVMVGYPNGIWDDVNNMPVFRRGVTATHPRIDYRGRSEFMIDAACFPGSSGSPVLLFNVGHYSNDGGVVIGNRIKLLGVLYAGPQHTAAGDIVITNVPTATKPMAISRIPNNLGVVIKAQRLTEFDALFGT